jgi:hypothetical protein
MVKVILYRDTMFMSPNHGNNESLDSNWCGLGTFGPKLDPWRSGNRSALNRHFLISCAKYAVNGSGQQFS